ncbi:MAG: sulfotransferase [Acidobacteriota bacterium]
MSIERRLFLVGVPRSGTTLLQSLLAAHSEITSFTESHLLSRHFSLLPIVGRPVLRSDLGARVRGFLRENGLEVEQAEAWAESFDRLGGLGRELRTEAALREVVALFDRLCRERGSRTWLEKTPRHLRFVPATEDALDPDLRRTVETIHLVRRPLETVASLHLAARDWPEPYSLEECVARWDEDVAFTLEQLDRPRQHLVLYEELCERPEATLRSLLDALGLAWQSALLEEFASQAKGLVLAEESWKDDVARPLEASSRSVEKLSPARRAEIEESVDHGLYERAYDRATAHS